MTGYRKFALASFASACAGFLCYTSHLSGGEWVTAQSIILGLYKGADVLNRRANGSLTGTDPK